MSASNEIVPVLSMSIPYVLKLPPLEVPRLTDDPSAVINDWASYWPASAAPCAVSVSRVLRAVLAAVTRLWTAELIEDTSLLTLRVTPDVTALTEKVTPAIALVKVLDELVTV